MRRERDEVQNIMIQLASRAEGMTHGDLMEAIGGTASNISPRISIASKRGKLFKVDCGHRASRWFASKRQAEIYEERHTIALREAREKQAERVKAEAKKRRAERDAAKRLAAKIARGGITQRQAIPKQAQNIVFSTKANPAPVTIKAKPEAFKTAKPDFSKAKITRCPSPGYDTRYQVAPGTKVVGGFASMGPGRYL
jgi:hypothetical protein